jgi:hypothetical protein
MMRLNSPLISIPKALEGASTLAWISGPPQLHPPRLLSFCHRFLLLRQVVVDNRQVPSYRKEMVDIFPVLAAGNNNNDGTEDDCA